MTSAERLCIVAARSEGLLVDFVLIFLVRWGLKLVGADYLYFQPFLSDVAPPLSLEDFRYPASALFWGAMYFSSGMPEVIFFGAWFVYAVLTLAFFGRTLGMRQAGLVLVDATGRKPVFWRIVLRQLLMPVSSIAWLGFVFAGFTPNAEAFHDLVSGTRVTYVQKREL
ncbi:MAG: RDD family protein [Armatimonadetes bacterium]|nr:RDD family protein [Armatimonadota bacterium]